MSCTYFAYKISDRFFFNESAITENKIDSASICPIVFVGKFFFIYFYFEI